jgi:predicted nucleotidyltransferase
MKRQTTHGRVPQPFHSTTRHRRGQIARFCAVIAREFQPEKIILFGSWAYGRPDADSDVDLLVVMPFEGSPFRQAGIILNRVIQSVGVLPFDLLVRTPEQLHERLAIGDVFVHEILARGRCCMKPTTLEWMHKAEPSSSRLPLRIAILASSPPEPMPKTQSPIAGKCGT